MFGCSGNQIPDPGMKAQVSLETTIEPHDLLYHLGLKPALHGLNEKSLSAIDHRLTHRELSVLCLLLFSIFINDITDNFTHVMAKLFADDIKLYTSLSSTHPAAVTTFQHHLDLIHSWATTWQIGISFSKCNILQIGTHSHQSNYSVSNHTLLPVNQVRDLGVLIDSELKFNHHILDCVTRARSRSYLIFRGFLSRDTSHRKRAFITYYQPSSIVI